MKGLTPELSCGAQWRRVVVDATTKVGATKRHQLERIVRRIFYGKSVKNSLAGQSLVRSLQKFLAA